MTDEQVMERWIKQYGKVFGYYLGEIPYIVITDVDLIKEIFLKRASVFCDRPQQLVNVEPFKSCIIGLEGKHATVLRFSPYIRAPARQLVDGAD